MVAYEAMEKRRPTYDLEAIKAVFGAVDQLAMTSSALRDATALGFDRAGVVETIGGIERRMFYKSMTTHADHRLWQDVYRPTTEVGDIYLKLTVIDDVLIVSFKEL